MKLLDIPWDVFRNLNNDIKLRMGSVEVFLLPMLYLVKEAATVEEFYVRKMPSIYNDLLLKIENSTKVRLFIIVLVMMI